MKHHSAVYVHLNLFSIDFVFNISDNQAIRTVCILQVAMPTTRERNQRKFLQSRERYDTPRRYYCEHNQRHLKTAMLDYFQAEEFFLDHLWFYHDGSHYHGAGMLRWEAAKGFHIAARVKRSRPYPHQKNYQGSE